MKTNRQAHFFSQMAEEPPKYFSPNICTSEAKLQERLSLAANGQTSPKHQTGEGILQTVPWPVLLLCVTGRIVQLD